MRRKGLLAGFLVGITVGLIAVTIAMQPAASSESDDDLMKEFFQPLAWAVQQIQRNYVEEVKAEDLLVGAYEGMMSKLDKYSTHIPPARFKEFKADTEGEFGGLGIQIRFMPIEKVVHVEQPIPGTPAFKKGILAGDKIIKIKQESGEVVKTQELDNVHDAVELLRGEPGTEVTITVVHERSPNKPVDITIERAIIETPGVRAMHMVDEQRKIGYVYLASFHEQTLQDLDVALKKLREQDMQALVVDLRFNPGGLLNTATEVSDRFLEEGVVVSTKGRSSREQVYKAHKDGDDCVDIPLVVLVNEYSASASEIVAGAIKDQGRGIILGEKTYGKGSVQSLMQLPGDRGALKLTTARYYTPSGVCIEDVGIKPDIEVTLPPEEDAKLVSHLSDYVSFPPKKSFEEGEQKDEEKKQESATESSEANAEDGEENEEAEEFEDVQLKRAVDVLRGILVQQKLTERRKQVAVGALD